MGSRQVSGGLTDPLTPGVGCPFLRNACRLEGQSSMTLRELLKSLHAVDEKHLDIDVMVSPASGGHRGISHVSVLYVGHAVIHLAEPTPVEPPDLWAGSGEGDSVAAVSPDDLRKVWQLFRD